MFSSKSSNMAKANETEPNAFNQIASGTSITGEIISNGDIRIDGSLKGNLTTKGKLVIGPTGTITGEIQCKNADISGRFEGKINVAELLSLKATSTVIGDIITSKLAIEAGAKFNGTCNMDGGTANQNATAQGKPQPKA